MLRATNIDVENSSVASVAWTTLAPAFNPKVLIA